MVEFKSCIIWMKFDQQYAEYSLIESYKKKNKKEIDDILSISNV